MPILRRTLGMTLSASLVAMALLVAAPGSVMAATTHWVNDDELTPSAPGNDCADAGYTMIQDAVDAASPGDTIQVCPGNYAEQVQVNKSVLLLGAQAGVDPGGRSSASLTESAVRGSFTVTAPNVTIDGFSVTLGSPSRSGIIVKTSGSGSLVTFNVIEDIGSLSFTGTERDNAVGVYLELGPDNVDVVRNKMSRIFSTNGSAQGVLVGDSTSGDPSLDVLIDGNIVEGLESVFRGAYGIQINNGASTVSTATGHTTGVVRGNRIDGLTGGWAHGVGLEGPTPGLAVLLNNFSNLTDATPVAFNDVFGVLVQSNPHWDQIQINQNNFVLKNMADHGIGVDPSTPGTGIVDGTCNWWNAPNGPGPVGPGDGALVTANVDYDPWLIAPAPGGACVGEPLPPAGKVTGGGQVPVPEGRGSFGFNARLDEGETTGHLNYRNHGTGAHLNCTVTAFLVLTPTTATFEGTCNEQSSADSFTAHVEDHGEPGRNSDVFEITYDGSSTGTEGGPLTAGNIQIQVEPAAESASAESSDRGGTGAGEGAFPSGATFSGISLSGLEVGTGVSIGPDGAAAGQFVAVLLGTSLLGQPQEISVDGKVGGGSIGPDGSATVSGSATVDLGDGSVPLLGVPFTVTATTESVLVQLDTSTLPSATLTGGSITIE